MTTDQQHTPEPWHIGVRTAHSKRDIYGPQGELVALADACLTDLETAQVNARRIVACVNACAGISDNELTHGPVIALSRYSALANEKAELIEALRECITETPGAACYNTGKKTRRLEAINETARAILAKVQP